MATMRSIGMRARAAISGETRTSYLRSRSESRSLASIHRVDGELGLIVILGGSVAAGEGGPSVFVVSRSRLGVFAVRRRRLRGVFVQR